MKLVRRLLPRSKSISSTQVPDRDDNGEIRNGTDADGGYESSGSSVPGSGTVTPREREGRELKGGRLAAVRAGGKRRKAVRR
jgi:hypothetical protein